MPLPPIPIDSYRKWATDRWTAATQAIIDATPLDNWALDAGTLIQDTFTQARQTLAPPEPPPPPPPPPEPEPVFPQAPPMEVQGPPSPDFGQRAQMGAQSALGGPGDWTALAQQQIANAGGVFSDLGTGLQSSLGAQQALEQTARETTERERGTTYAQPGGELPGGWTAPETGTPEGEAITSQLAQTFAEQAPLGGGPQGYLRQIAPTPMTADTPLQNAMTLAGGLTTPVSLAGDVLQAGASRALGAVPGGETSLLAGLGVREDTPFLGGATTPDVAIPAALGLFSPGTGDELARLGRALPGADLATRGAEEYAAAARRMGVTPGAGFADVSRAAEEVPQDVLRAQAAARLSGGAPPAAQAGAAVEDVVARLERLQREAQALEAAQPRSGLLGPGGEAIEITPRTPALPDAATDAARSNLFSNLMEVFNNYTLAGPLTLVSNLTGGLTQTALNALEVTTSAGPRAGLRYGRRVLGAVPEALGEGRRILTEGTEAFGREGASPATQELALQGGLSQGQGAWRTAGSWATRANAGTDRAIWTVNQQAARALGIELGFGGTQLDDFAKRYAEEATFSGRASSFGQALTEARGKLTAPDANPAERAAGALVYGLAPFVRVPERILRQSLDLATLGGQHVLNKEAFSNNPAVKMQARGRIGAALALSGAMSLQAARGAITGDGPQDPDDRLALESRTNAAGDPLWRRNSWKVEVPAAGPEGTSRVFWLPSRMFGSLGQLSDITANAVDAVKREAQRAGPGAGLGAVAPAAVSAYVGAIAATALGDSWLDDISRFAERTKRSGGREFVPAVGELAAGMASRPLAAVAPLTRAVDPSVREVDRGNPLATAAERLPGVRRLLPEAIDPTTGEPVVRSGTTLERAAGTTPVSATAVRRELARLGALRGPDGRALYTGVSPRTFDEKTVRYAGMTQDAAAKRVLQQAFGSETNRYLGLLVADPRYQRATDAEKASMVQDALGEASVRADARAGPKIARDAKSRANYEYLALPHYEGILPSAGADAVRTYNLDVADAKQQLARYRDRYPNNPNQGQTEFYREHPDLLALALKPGLDATSLRLKRQDIAKRVGVEPDADAGRGVFLVRPVGG